MCAWAMRFLEDRITRIWSVLEDKSAYMGTALIGVVLLLVGYTIKPYPYKVKNRLMVKMLWVKGKAERIAAYTSKIFSKIPIVNAMKKEIKINLQLFLVKDDVIELISDGLALGIIVVGLAIYCFLNYVGQFWYVKVLVFAISIFIPYYILLFLFELKKYYLNRQIPHMIDEFRSAFINNGRIRSAFIECSKYIDKGLGKMLVAAADSPNMVVKLKKIQDKLNNMWFNLFLISIVEYKDKGGELAGQLYKISRTIGRSIGIEKKKNKRLILYEGFVVSAAVLSIPTIMWVNSTITGNTPPASVADVASNITISRILISSLISLVIIHVLRKF